MALWGGVVAMLLALAAENTALTTVYLRDNGIGGAELEAAVERALEIKTPRAVFARSSRAPQLRPPTMPLRSR